MPYDGVSLRDIYSAKLLCAGFTRRTPLIESPVLAERVGGPVYLKLENLQETGSFKIRGVFNKLLSLTEDEQKRGVITFSTGNHGLATAYAARQLALHSIICLSKRVPNYRIEAIRRYGAEVVTYGQSQDEAMNHASCLQKERGLTFINAFDDPFIVAGHGTIALELLEDLPDVDTVLVPLSGGGLISGIALALKAADPGIRVLGVTMERSAVMHHSLQAGQSIEMPEEDTLADALLGGIGLQNQYTFRMCQEYVDDTILVSEALIAKAMVFALEKHRMVTEGAGAVGIAALLDRKLTNTGRSTVAVVTGGNVELALLLRLATQQSGDASTSQ